MIYLAIDKDGKAHLFRTKPYRDGEQWKCVSTKDIPFPVLPVELSAVSMWLNKTNLTWQDEPIEIYTEPQEKMVSLDKTCEYLESALKHDLGYYGAADFADTFRKTMEKQSMELTIEKIQECKKVNEFLDDVCEKYFKTHAPDWRYYGGWKFSDNYPNCIVIHYGFYDWRDQYESGDKVIPMDVLIDFSKRYKKNE